eukprot:TRINITY_DN30040_c0_g1_i1.p1 TRINITY_DN30040_c0_g1~~TRINITY_DN30040_c0_g1_i1.p1  ORF type:complete len:1007 (-),score=172.05 TRINITY_DN30040_c0_g1_i1:166-3186(-)
MSGADTDVANPTVAFLLWVETAALQTERSASGKPPTLPSEGSAAVPEELRKELHALAKILPAACAGDFSTLMAEPWLEPVAKMLQRAQVESTVTSAGFHQLRLEIQSGGAAFVAAAPACEGAKDARRVALLLVAVCALQVYMRTTWTGPALSEDELSGLPFDANSPVEISTKAGEELLSALEIDGEPLYELCKGLGFLWLAAAMLGVLPTASDGDVNGGACVGGETVALWRGRCAFAWQLSLAEASERGEGQSPSLFRFAVHDLVGTTAAPGPLALSGALDGSTLAAVRSTTVPVLNVHKTLRESGPPVVLAVTTNLPSEEDKPENVETHLSEASGPLALVPSSVRAVMCVELALRLCWYGRPNPYQAVLSAACTSLGASFEITGAMGIKRKYQHEEFAQLMVKFKSKDNVQPGSTDNVQSGDADSTSAAAEAELAPENEAPKQLKLNEVDDLNDVLEVARLSDKMSAAEIAEFQRVLDVNEQLLMLLSCSHKWVVSNPNDELMLQEVNAYAQRALTTTKEPLPPDAPFATPEDSAAHAAQTAEAETAAKADGPLFTSNWLNFSCALYFRCRAEHHRNKTRERASFQLQALVDQFNDERPSAAHRLQTVHSAGYPARFHMQREYGMRMMNMGMVSTAHEQFKALNMWQEAVDCLAAAGRNVEGTAMVKELLADRPTPRLWCCLGDIEREPAHYETAWELSNHRFARAQRSLARHYFEKGQLEKAVDSFRLALDINPLFSNCWFTMGVAEMRLQRYESCVYTFARCLGIDDSSAETWANLAAVHSQRGSLVEARSCMNEACKRNRSSWKMWESWMGICMKLRDLQGVINALRQFVEMNRIDLVKEQILGIVTMAVIGDKGGLYENQTGGRFTLKLLSFFEFATSRHSSTPFIWRFYAELQDSQGQVKEATESRKREARAAQARLWNQGDPEVFTCELMELCDCFMALEPKMDTDGDEELQSLAYSVRNAERQLQQKIDSAVTVPSEWSTAHEQLASLAARLEKRVSK